MAARNLRAATIKAARLLHRHKDGNCKIRWASKILYASVKRSVQNRSEEDRREFGTRTLFHVVAMCMRITPQMANPCINKVLLLKCDNYKSWPSAVEWKKKRIRALNSFIASPQLLNKNKSDDKPSAIWPNAPAFD